MAGSCSHWWHAPIYATISVILAVTAISTSYHPDTKAQIPHSVGSDSLNLHKLSLSLNASRALRREGFNFMATILLISPEEVLPSSESTIFAIQDHDISNVSLPPWLMKDLLHYHTSPSKLSLEDLSKKPQGRCIPTLLPGKNLAITKIDGQERKVEINHVLISHPDIFVEGPYSIHGIPGPFTSFDPREIEPDWDFIRSPICDSNGSLVADASEARNRVPWSRILRLLSSNGFISFAVGLHGVLDGILRDNVDLSSVTIFAPPDLAYVGSPSPLLETIVRLHILPQRYTYRELSLLPEKASLKTLLPDEDLQITSEVSFTGTVSINGIKITTPDFISSQEFMIHGISRALEKVKLSTISR
ncbi:PREDICTED: fasciclin-like arabinogalactan protein 21 [Nelumbo nucifera]|uniref:FAS1 domain-containing protein n=2 Tax=Nelumbo nucifera TaxID=4432 RepID=A0A822ZEU2_NELNU|nr:PREDICTED: fasciclin-like arabinogalactan protein 21 [Nelumbo nucifera]DAD40118.1 TPA_asm: hypothetical protein HUJ06_014441 [Nelumbo nucifera]